MQIEALAQELKREIAQLEADNLELLADLDRLYRERTDLRNYVKELEATLRMARLQTRKKTEDR